MRSKTSKKADLRAAELMNMIIEMRESIEEEFDMVELIEDNIKEIFQCNLNCITCTDEERGICMQKFKKANIYWLRKIAQDEWMIRDIVEKLDSMRESLEKMQKYTIRYLKQIRAGKKIKDEDFDDIFEEEKKRRQDKDPEPPNFYQ